MPGFVPGISSDQLRWLSLACTSRIPSASSCSMRSSKHLPGSRFKVTLTQGAPAVTQFLRALQLGSRRELVGLAHQGAHDALGLGRAAPEDVALVAGRPL